MLEPGVFCSGYYRCSTERMSIVGYCRSYFKLTPGCLHSSFYSSLNNNILVPSFTSICYCYCFDPSTSVSGDVVYKYLLFSLSSLLLLLSQHHNARFFYERLWFKLPQSSTLSLAHYHCSHPYHHHISSCSPVLLVIDFLNASTRSSH